MSYEGYERNTIASRQQTSVYRPQRQAYAIKPRLVNINRVAQFIGICRWLKLVYMWTRSPQRSAPLCTRLARKRRRDTQLLSQCLRATNCYKLSESIYSIDRPFERRLERHTLFESGLEKDDTIRHGETTRQNGKGFFPTPEFCCPIQGEGDHCPQKGAFPC